MTVHPSRTIFISLFLILKSINFFDRQAGLAGPDLTPIKPTPIKCDSYKLYRFDIFFLDFIGHSPFQCPIIFFVCPITFEFEFECPINFYF